MYRIASLENNSLGKNLIIFFHCQRWWRAKLQRLSYLRTRYLVCLVQRKWRKRFAVKYQSAARIQAVVRSFLARRTAEKRKEAILVIQVCLNKIQSQFFYITQNNSSRKETYYNLFQISSFYCQTANSSVNFHYLLSFCLSVRMARLQRQETF